MEADLQAGRGEYLFLPITSTYSKRGLRVSNSVVEVVRKISIERVPFLIKFQSFLEKISRPLFA